MTQRELAERFELRADFIGRLKRGQCNVQLYKVGDIVVLVVNTFESLATCQFV